MVTQRVCLCLYVLPDLGPDCLSCGIPPANKGPLFPPPPELDPPEPTPPVLARTRMYYN